MTDPVFGALDFDGCCWNGHVRLEGYCVLGEGFTHD